MATAAQVGALRRAPGGEESVERIPGRRAARGGQESAHTRRVLDERRRPRWPGSREAPRWRRHRAPSSSDLLGAAGKVDDKRAWLGWAGQGVSGPSPRRHVVSVNFLFLFFSAICFASIIK